VSDFAPVPTDHPMLMYAVPLTPHERAVVQAAYERACRTWVWGRKSRCTKARACGGANSCLRTKRRNRHRRVAPARCHSLQERIRLIGDAA